jgi:hypothetical protein
MIFVGRRIECAFPDFEVEEHAHASLHQLLECVRGFDGFASDPSDITSTWNGARRFKAFISRRNPNRLLNSAPLIPSSRRPAIPQRHPEANENEPMKALVYEAAGG